MLFLLVAIIHQSRVCGCALHLVEMQHDLVNCFKVVFRLGWICFHSLFAWLPVGWANCLCLLFVCVFYFELVLISFSLTEQKRTVAAAVEFNHGN